MENLLVHRKSQFANLLRVREEGEVLAVQELITPTYLGHMLHLEGGERTALTYPNWIARFRDLNPNTKFIIHAQSISHELIWTRLSAHRGDRAVSMGINQSRFEGELIAEEWAIWSTWTEPNKMQL